MSTTLKPFVLRDGRRLLVIRPRDQALALKIAKEAVDENYSQEKFDAILAQQSYTVIGFLGRSIDKKRVVIVDHKGEKIGYAESGDSFVGTTDELMDQLKPGDPFIVTEKPVGQA